MRSCHVLLAVLIGLTWGLPVQAQPGEAATDITPEVQRWVDQLSHSRYALRERARIELEKIGPAALPALQKAASSADPEVSHSAELLIQKLEEQQQREKLLAPTRVNLVCKDMPVMQAVAELKRQSGYHIVVQGDTVALKKQRVTLDTGDTTFWQAFDALCLKAGLVEVAHANYATTFPPSPADIVPPPGGGLIPPPPPPILVPRAAIQIPKQQADQMRKQALKARQEVLKLRQLHEQKHREALEKINKMRQEQQRRLQQFQQRQARPGFQLQVQAPPVPLPVPKVQQIQVWGGPIAGSGIATRRINSNQGEIIVRPGQPQPVPTYYTGAVRIQVLPQSPPDKSETVLRLRISPEPRLSQFVPSAVPILERATNERGEELDMVLPQQQITGPHNPYATTAYYPTSYAVPMPGDTYTVRLKNGSTVAQTLKHLSMRWTVQLLTPPEPLLVIDNVMQAAGKKAAGKTGGSLEVISIRKENGRDIRVSARLENPPGVNPFGVQMGGNVVMRINGQIIIQGNGTSSHTALPVLLDTNGKQYQLVQVPSQQFQVINGRISQVWHMLFRAHPDQTEPEQLVVTGQRPACVQIPLHLENVPLR